MAALTGLQRALRVPEARIAQILLRLHQGIEALMRRLGEEMGLSPTQIQVLLFLSHAHPDYRGVSAIAKRFSIAPATASRVIDNLEGKGLVRRAREKGDRRRVRVELTPAGRKVAARILEIARRLENYVKQLPGGKLEALSQGLEGILRAFHQDGYLALSSICRTCPYFKENAYPDTSKSHLCRLTGERLSDKESYLERLDEAA